MFEFDFQKEFDKVTQTQKTVVDFWANASKKVIDSAVEANSKFISQAETALSQYKNFWEKK